MYTIVNNVCHQGFVMKDCNRFKYDYNPNKKTERQHLRNEYIDILRQRKLCVLSMLDNSPANDIPSILYMTRLSDLCIVGSNDENVKH